MGFGGISVWQLLIVLVIIVLIFGTKKFRNIGGDLGNAVKGFKKAMNEDEADKEPKQISKEDAEFSETTAKKTEQTEQDKTPEK